MKFNGDRGWFFAIYIVCFYRNRTNFENNEQIIFCKYFLNVIQSYWLHWAWFVKCKYHAPINNIWNASVCYCNQNISSTFSKKMPQKTEKFIKAIYNSLNNNTGSEKILMLHSTLRSMFLFWKCKRHNWHGEILVESR